MKNEKKVKGIGTQTSMSSIECILFSIIVLTLAIVRKATGSIKFRGSKASRLARAVEIVNACAVSTWVTIAPDVITAINALITSYRNADAAGNASAFKALNDAIRNDLLSLFQKAADNNPEHAESILRSGAFSVYVGSGRSAQFFGISDGVASGSINLIAKGGGRKAHCNDWFYSPDGTTWTRLRPTTGSTTIAADLPVGSIAYFKHELIIEDVPQGESEVLSIIVR